MTEEKYAFIFKTSLLLIIFATIILIYFFIKNFYFEQNTNYKFNQTNKTNKMKTIQNKKTSLFHKLDESTREPVASSYSDLLQLTINHPSSQGGFSLSDIRARLKILDVLIAATDTITLNDSDFALIKQVFESHKWPAVHKDIIEFSDYLNTL